MSPSSSVASFAALVAAYAAEDGVDAVLLQEAVHAAVVSALGNIAAQSGRTAQQNAARFAELCGLREQLANVKPTADGTSMKLGPDLASGRALQAQISAAGFSLTTAECHAVNQTTTVASGPVAVTYNQWNDLVAPETLDQIRRDGKLVKDDGVIEQYRIDYADKSYQVFDIYKNVGAITASPADFTTLQASIYAEVAVLCDSLQTENLRIRASCAAAQERLEAGPLGLPEARKRQREAQGAREDAARETQTEAIQRRPLEHARLQRHNPQELEP